MAWWTEISPPTAWRLTKRSEGLGLGAFKNGKSGTAPIPHIAAPRLENLDHIEIKVVDTFKSPVPLEGQHLIEIGIDQKTGDLIYSYERQQSPLPLHESLPLNSIPIHQEV